MANSIYATEAYRSMRQVIEWKDDFIGEIDTTNNYTATLTDTGTAVVGNLPGGVVVLSPSDGTVADNDEAYLGLRNLVFTPAAGRPIVAEALLQYAEVATNAANIGFGLTNTVAADLLVDNGGGMKTTGSHFAIFKIDGETVWRVESRIGTTVLRNTTTVTAGGSEYALLQVFLSELLTTHMTVTFAVNGIPLVDSVTNMPIAHRITYTSVDALTPFVAVKNGTAVQQPLNLDFWIACQNR